MLVTQKKKFTYQKIVISIDVRRVIVFVLRFRAPNRIKYCEHTHRAAAVKTWSPISVTINGRPRHFIPGDGFRNFVSTSSCASSERETLT